MRILALDIGSGTEDVLLYDDSKEIENCVKMVLPSPSRVYAKRVRYLTRLRSDLFIKGETIGGGQFVEALKKHLSTGLRVILTEDVAYSVRNNLEEVRARGFQIVSGGKPPEDFKGETLQIQEINLSRLQSFLDSFEEDSSSVDAVAIAVQDHGTPPKTLSNRRFRIDEIRKRLEDHPRLESLAYVGHEVPKHFIRMCSAVKTCRSLLPEAKPIVMDTSLAAILGCLEDSKVKRAGTALLANIGNEHVTASVVSKGKVLAVLEHHTSLLTSKRLESMLKNFIKGKLKNEQVFEEGGHGTFYLQEPSELPKIDIIAVTGPNRNRLRMTQHETYFAVPAGDMMMTGPIGLVKATLHKIR